MALTAKPISTISYNTEGFLQRLLDRLLSSNIIVDYRYIYHYGEDGDKDHYHVWIEPNKRIDTGALMDEFKEADPTNDKPLGCLPFRTSKSDHWLMYVLHDADYLKAHHSDNDGDGKIAYDIHDIRTPYEEQLMRDYKKALPLKQTENQQIIELIKLGMTVTEICSILNVNPSRVAVLFKAYQYDRIDIKNRTDQEIEVQKIRRLLATVGGLSVVEEFPGTKEERRNGIVREHVTHYEISNDTGEVKTKKEWRTVGEDDEEKDEKNDEIKEEQTNLF